MVIGSLGEFVGGGELLADPKSVLLGVSLSHLLISCVENYTDYKIEVIFIHFGENLLTLSVCSATISKASNDEAFFGGLPLPLLIGLCSPIRDSILKASSALRLSLSKELFDQNKKI